MFAWKIDLQQTRSTQADHTTTSVHGSAALRRQMVTCADVQSASDPVHTSPTAARPSLARRRLQPKGRHATSLQPATAPHMRGAPWTRRCEEEATTAGLCLRQPWHRGTAGARRYGRFTSPWTWRWCRRPRRCPGQPWHRGAAGARRRIALMSLARSPCYFSPY